MSDLIDALDEIAKINTTTALLNFSGKAFNDDDITKIAEKLKENHNITNLSLNLSCNNFGDVGTAALSQINFLKNLDVSNGISGYDDYFNNITDIGAAALANGCLEKLNISGNTSLGDKGIAVLTKIQTLIEITAMGCGITYVGAKAVFSAINKIEAIILAENDINDAGLSEIALGALPNLKYLDLSCCGISTIGVEKIVLITSLEHLIANYNHINNQSALFLAKHPNLKYLFLCGCDIGDDGAKELIDNQNYLTVNLYGNHISDTIFTKAKERDFICNGYIFTRIEQYKKKLADGPIERQSTVFPRSQSAPEKLQSNTSKDVDDFLINTSFSSNYSNTPSPKDSMGLSPIEEKKEPPIVPQFQLKRPKEIEKEDELISKPKRHSPNSQDSSSISSNDSLGVRNMKLANDDTCYKTHVSTNNKQDL